jgi:UDP-4-amino-4,6-dideoxy-N-acetyl-beta-L-altrosamine transaminase
MKRFLPYGRQDVGGEETRRVRDVLESDWLTQGPKVPEFETALATFCGAAHAVAVANGTLALYLACRAAGLGPGDRFIVPPITFVATANAGVLCGAEPVFVDIDPGTLTLDADKVEAALLADPRIRVIMPVHMGGRVADLPALKRLADRHGAVIIEDACHAIGTRWQDEGGAWHRVGDGSHGVMTCFSFHPVKSITTGEGGAITTNDPVLAEKLAMLRTHGITREPSRLERQDGPWYYEMHELGLNARLTDMQAAMGLVQLQKLERLCKRRQELVARYDRAFERVPRLRVQARPVPDGSCWHLMIVRTEDRDALYKVLASAQIGSQVHYYPVHLQPYYRRQFGTGPGLCPAAETYYTQALSLPLFPTMSDADQTRVIKAVRRFVAGPATVAVAAGAGDSVWHDGPDGQDDHD